MGTALYRCPSGIVKAQRTGKRSLGEVATEEADQGRAREWTKPATSSGRSKPASRSPNGIASATRIKACAMSNETSRRERQGHRSIAMRRIGVTTMRSTTPSRISSHSPKPRKAEPKRAVMNQDSGNEDVERAAGREARHLGNVRQERPEQKQVLNTKPWRCS